MRILDLFSCAGGAAVGYHRAGFDVVGVDIAPQPRYPFAFIQSDVLALDQRFLRSFDAIHASPPCQGYTAMRHAPGAKGAPMMIDQTRSLLEATGRPWIIENVEEARWAMREPIMLCGSMFGLGAQGCRTQRHRLFESNVAISAPSPCDHDARPVVGVYGGHARKRSAKAGGRGTRDVWEGGHKAAAGFSTGRPPEDLLPWLEDRKWAYIRLEGRNFGDVPLNVELKLEVWDSPNSAGVIIDAVRCARLALDRGIGGPLLGPSAWFMKSPPEQYHDDVARDRLDEYIKTYRRRATPAAETVETATGGADGTP